MEEVDSEKLKKFYEEKIRQWIIGDLEGVKNIGANLLTMLGCFVYTEIVGIFLPTLGQDVEEKFCYTGKGKDRKPSEKREHFYRCLFRLKSGENLKIYDEKLRRITKAYGIYSLRNEAVHKYLPLIKIETEGIIEFVSGDVRGTHNPIRPSIPIFLEEDSGKISYFIINNVEYIEELKNLVNDVYNKIFIEKDNNFVTAMNAGYNKLFEKSNKTTH